MTGIGGGEGNLNQEPDIRVEKLDLKKLNFARKFSDFIERNRKDFMKFKAITQNSYPDVKHIRGLHHMYPRMVHYGAFVGDELVATVGLTRSVNLAHVADIGYLVDTDRRGANIAARAVRHAMKSHPEYTIFYASMNPGNTASIKVAEKVGFELLPQEIAPEMRHERTDLLFRYDVKKKPLS